MGAPTRGAGFKSGRNFQGALDISQLGLSWAWRDKRQEAEPSALLEKMKYWSFIIRNNGQGISSLPSWIPHCYLYSDASTTFHTHLQASYLNCCKYQMTSRTFKDLQLISPEFQYLIKIHPCARVGKIKNPSASRKMGIKDVYTVRSGSQGILPNKSHSFFGWDDTGTITNRAVRVWHW